jgi:hypothetical protein
MFPAVYIELFVVFIAMFGVQIVMKDFAQNA